ncbi:hypothetical protein HDE76_001134 [Rhodanobacter sp. ANJX3]|nr:hypothetical protein [Rhodanobacter sp. ANJX3]
MTVLLSLCLAPRREQNTNAARFPATCINRMSGAAASMGMTLGQQRRHIGQR